MDPTSFTRVPIMELILIQLMKNVVASLELLMVHMKQHYFHMTKMESLVNLIQIFFNSPSDYMEGGGRHPKVYILKMTPSSSSSFKLKSRRHVRSISFPSRPQPVFHHLDEQLNRINDIETDSTSLSCLGDRLSFLQDLYVSVDDLIQMPHIQQSLASVLADDSYIKIMDACTVTKDIFSQAKHDVQELLSSLRRRKDVTDASGMYLASRKKAKKTIQKALKNIKNIKISERADQLEAICLLNNVQSVTVCVLESSLSYVMGTKSQSSFVSKLIHNKCKEESQNEFNQMNEALIVPDNESIQRQLEKMQLGIQNIEEGLDCLFKHLIKTRVSLLNLLSY